MCVLDVRAPTEQQSVGPKRPQPDHVQTCLHRAEQALRKDDLGEAVDSETSNHSDEAQGLDFGVLDPCLALLGDHVRDDDEEAAALLQLPGEGEQVDLTGIRREVLVQHQQQLRPPVLGVQLCLGFQGEKLVPREVVSQSLDGIPPVPAGVLRLDVQDQEARQDDHREGAVPGDDDHQREAVQRRSPARLPHHGKQEAREVDRGIHEQEELRDEGHDEVQVASQAREAAEAAERHRAIIGNRGEQPRSTCQRLQACSYRGKQDADLDALGNWPRNVRRYQFVTFQGVVRHEQPEQPDHQEVHGGGEAQRGHGSGRNAFARIAQDAREIRTLEGICDARVEHGQQEEEVRRDAGVRIFLVGRQEVVAELAIVLPERPLVAPRREERDSHDQEDDAYQDGR
eukprot:scaffold7205_cov239-Pinguiococcus_pyrenoidosus.AAC.3